METNLAIQASHKLISILNTSREETENIFNEIQTCMAITNTKHELLKVNNPLLSFYDQADSFFRSSILDIIHSDINRPIKSC